MSADNGIYIASFPTKDRKGKEYRVIEASAIENTHMGIDKKVDECYQAIYFADSEIFSEHAQATKYAIELAQDYPFLEYGICDLSFDNPIALTRGEARRILASLHD